MKETETDAYRFSQAFVIVFGLLGNILVIISILRQKNVLKNNYYFLVLHLVTCDLVTLIIYLLDEINVAFLQQKFFDHDFSKFDCLGYNISYLFQVSGIGMMLMISVHRYRATVHPLKPAISRQKLKLICGLVYFVGFFTGYLPAMPPCFMQNNNDVKNIFEGYFYGYILCYFYFCPTIFMAVVYVKIAQTLTSQNKYIKGVCAHPAVRRSVPSSRAFFINRKTFLICLLTVLCYAVGNIPMTGWIILKMQKKKLY